MAKHTSSQDPSFRASLARHLGGGAALIVVVAVAFLGIGQLGQQTSTPSAADVPEPEEEPEAPEPADAEDAEELDEPEEPDEVEEPEAEEPEADAEPDDGDDPAAEDPDEGEEGDDGADAGEAPAQAEETSAPAFAASEISLQVLDGVGTDGGNAASQMAQRLRDGGFNVVAQNPALAYETTTVLWTSGNEAKARQVAAEIGAGAVRPQPGNLSESVDVHVVVGADRA